MDFDRRVEQLISVLEVLEKWRRNDVLTSSSELARNSLKYFFENCWLVQLIGDDLRYECSFKEDDFSQPDDDQLGIVPLIPDEFRAKWNQADFPDYKVPLCGYTRLSNVICVLVPLPDTSHFSALHILDSIARAYRARIDGRVGKIRECLANDMLVLDYELCCMEYQVIRALLPSYADYIETLALKIDLNQETEIFIPGAENWDQILVSEFGDPLSDYASGGRAGIVRRHAVMKACLIKQINLSVQLHLLESLSNLTAGA